MVRRFCLDGVNNVDFSALDCDVRQKFDVILKNTKISKSDTKKSTKVKREMLNAFLKANTPSPLFRYRSMKPHTITALKNGQISLAKPCEQEKFDSLIEYDIEQINAIVHDYLPRVDVILGLVLSGVKIPREQLSMFPLIIQIFVKIMLWRKKKDVTFRRDIERTYKRAMKGMNVQLTEMASNAIYDELRYTRYIASFCEVGDHYKMWKDYASYPNGYVLEYDFSNGVPKDYILFPNVYETKYNATEFAIYKMMDWLPKYFLQMYHAHPYWERFFKKRNMLNFFDELFYVKGYVYKKKKFDYEQEWRLLSPETKKDSCVYSNVPFDPVAIYISGDMELSSFNELNQIAKDKGLQRFKALIDDNFKTVNFLPLP